jgi:hypothetical protein
MSTFVPMPAIQAAAILTEVAAHFPGLPMDRVLSVSAARVHFYGAPPAPAAWTCDAGSNYPFRWSVPAGSLTVFGCMGVGEALRAGCPVGLAGEYLRALALPAPPPVEAPSGLAAGEGAGSVGGGQ